jgi:pilus assembly protein Flp/PilA
MRNLYHSVVSFLKNEDGPTAVEYAVMLALIIVVCLGAVSQLGSDASNSFNYTASVVDTTAS